MNYKNLLDALEYDYFFYIKKEMLIPFNAVLDCVAKTSFGATYKYYYPVIYCYREEFIIQNKINKDTLVKINMSQIFNVCAIAAKNLTKSSKLTKKEFKLLKDIIFNLFFTIRTNNILYPIPTFSERFLLQISKEELTTELIILLSKTRKLKLHVYGISLEKIISRIVKLSCANDIQIIPGFGNYLILSKEVRKIAKDFIKNYPELSYFSFAIYTGKGKEAIKTISIFYCMSPIINRINNKLTKRNAIVTRIISYRPSLEALEELLKLAKLLKITLLEKETKRIKDFLKFYVIIYEVNKKHKILKRIKQCL